MPDTIYYLNEREDGVFYLNEREDAIYYLRGREVATAYVTLPEGFAGLALVIGINDDIVLTLTTDNDILTIR
jgi:hypothetical protein